MKVRFNKGDGRKVLQCELLKENKKTVWVRHPESGKPVKRKIHRDCVR